MNESVIFDIFTRCIVGFWATVFTMTFAGVGFLIGCRTTTALFTGVCMAFGVPEGEAPVAWVNALGVPDF